MGVWEEVKATLLFSLGCETTSPLGRTSLTPTMASIITCVWRFFHCDSVCTFWCRES